GMPDNSLVVMVRLEYRPLCPPYTDPVASAEEGLGRPVLSDEGGVHLVGVIGAVREDVADLDPTLDQKPALSAFGTDVSLTHVVDVDGLPDEIAPGHDIAQVGGLLIRAGEVGPTVHAAIDKDPGF